MSSKQKRNYNSANRNVAAAQTRDRILLSAKELFKSSGFEYVTIENIAYEAKVSGPTVYALFKSKLGILRALMDEALPTEQFVSLVAEARREKAASKHLCITAKIARQIYDAEKAQMDIFSGVSVLAPELKILEQEREQRRHKRLELTIKVIEQERSLKRNLTIAKAHDILWAFTGRDMYRMLVVEQGWTSDAYENWLAHLLITMLLEPYFKS